MIKELLYKLFNVEPFPCPTCEVLQIQLEESQRQNRYLLDKLINKDTIIPVAETPPTTEEMKPIGHRYTPWRVRQAAFEAEDRAKAEVLRQNNKEIEDAKKRMAAAQPADIQANINKLEQELGIKEA